MTENKIKTIRDIEDNFGTPCPPNKNKVLIKE
jgi:hypothetical protein